MIYDIENNFESFLLDPDNTIGELLKYYMDGVA